MTDRCRWCGDKIACLDWAERKPTEPLSEWHQDACCSCAAYIAENRLHQTEAFA